MCGRFTLKTAAALWVQELFPGLQLLDLPPDSPRYNIAPTQSILAIVQVTDSERLRAMETRWGLVPSWSKDLSIGAKMINARSETVAEKPSFRSAFSRRRCLIVADGYFEWPKGVGDGKQPYWIHRPNEKPFLMAGLYELNSVIQPQTPIVSSTILTIASNAAILPLHDRMPVIIDPRNSLRWLNPNIVQGSDVADLLRATDDDFFLAEPVDRYANNTRHEGPNCIAKVPSLF